MQLRASMHVYVSVYARMLRLCVGEEGGIFEHSRLGLFCSHTHTHTLSLSFVQIHVPPHFSRCNTLPQTATRRNTLQHTTIHCNTLQYTAPHCTTLHNTAPHRNTFPTRVPPSRQQWLPEIESRTSASAHTSLL